MPRLRANRTLHDLQCRPRVTPSILARVSQCRAWTVRNPCAPKLGHWDFGNYTLTKQVGKPALDQTWGFY